MGLPDAAVKESKERVRAAAISSGMTFPTGRITVNLAPAGTKKSGTVYDLPILVDILAATGQLKLPGEEWAFLGEVGMDGTLRGINGILPMALAAKKAGITTLVVPAENAPEATLAGGLTVYGPKTVTELRDHLTGLGGMTPETPWVPEASDVPMLDFQDVKGQENVSARWRSPRQAPIIFYWWARRAPARVALQAGFPPFCRI